MKLDINSFLLNCSEPWILRFPFVSSNDVILTLEHFLSKIARPVQIFLEQNDWDSDSGPGSVTCHVLTLWVEDHQY